jgi:hypothetical protein
MNLDANMSDISSAIIDRLKSVKCEGRIVSVEHLAELKSEIEEAHRAGQFFVCCRVGYQRRALLPKGCSLRWRSDGSSLPSGSSMAG